MQSPSITPAAPVSLTNLDLTHILDQLQMCDYLQIKNMGTGAYITNVFDPENPTQCLGVQMLMDPSSPNTYFHMEIDHGEEEEDTFFFWAQQNPDYKLHVDGDHVTCSEGEDDTTFFIHQFESDGAFLETTDEKPRYLSTQYNDQVKALISLETEKDMVTYAEETGDMSAKWQLKCLSHLEEKDIISKEEFDKLSEEDQERIINGEPLHNEFDPEEEFADMGDDATDSFHYKDMNEEEYLEY